MALYLLDTDMMTLWFYQNAKVRARFDAVAKTDRVAISLITRVEVLRGRFEAVLKAANRAEWLESQRRLRLTEEGLEDVEIVMIDDAAADQFDILRAHKKLKKIDRGDMLQAAIALANDATLVTRNTKDYANIPNLKLENWAA
ncbi:MAG: PIN domain-containing protein [Planctomycetia bacterium]|nr:PIN domain-containing protein [Planctomycetia bacterium]